MCHHTRLTKTYPVGNNLCARKLRAVSLTSCMAALPCAPGREGRRGEGDEEEEELMEKTGSDWPGPRLRAVTSHGGEVLWCKITSPFMGRGGAFHSRERGESSRCSLSAVDVNWPVRLFLLINKAVLDELSYFASVNHVFMSSPFNVLLLILSLKVDETVFCPLFSLCFL